MDDSLKMILEGLREDVRESRSEMSGVREHMGNMCSSIGEINAGMVQLNLRVDALERAQRSAPSATTTVVEVAAPSVRTKAEKAQTAVFGAGSLAGVVSAIGWLVKIFSEP